MSRSQILSLSSTQGRSFTKWDFCTFQLHGGVLDTGTEKIKVGDRRECPQPGLSLLGSSLSVPAFSCAGGFARPWVPTLPQGKTAQAVGFMDTWTKCFHSQQVKSQVCFHAQISTRQAAAAQSLRSQSV